VSVVRCGTEVLDAARGLTPLILEHQARIEHEQTLPRPVVDLQSTPACSAPTRRGPSAAEVQTALAEAEATLRGYLFTRDLPDGPLVTSGRAII
jgi:hypothetical protein